MAMVASMILVPRTGEAQVVTATSGELVAYWSCDELSGVRYDSTTNNLDLTDNNTVLYRTGILSNACDFTSANSEYLSIADGTDDPISFQDQSWTLNMWIYFDAITGYPGVFDNANGYDGLTCYAHTAQWFQCLGTLNGTGYDHNFSTSGYITASVWKMYTWVFNSDTFKLYSNGTLLQTIDTVNYSFVDNTVALWLGTYNATNYFDGALDEISYWSTDLDSTDISAIYNSGDGIAYSDLFGTTSTTSTSTATSTTTSADVSELKWVIELYLAIFMFLVFTWLGYRFTKFFL